MNAPPVFLYGFARSGTTLLTMMMGAHCELSVPLSVTGLWYRTFQSARLELSDQAIQTLVDTLCAHERIRLWKTDLSPSNIDVEEPNPSGVIAAFHQAQAAAEGKSRWANMDIATIDHLHLAATWFPDARFVHLVRDGRDVALSHQDYAFSEGNFLEIGRDWNALTLAAERIGQMLGDRHLTVRYEDLILNPEETLEKICVHIALAYDSSMLTYTQDVEQKIPIERRGLWPDIDRLPQKSKVKRYTREMRPYQRYVVESSASPALSYFGYDDDRVSGSVLTGELYGAWQWLTRGHRLDRFRTRMGLSPRKVRGA